MRPQHLEQYTIHVCVCFSCVINRRSQVQFESTFLNKVGQALLTLTFFSEAMLASSGCFSVSTEPLWEATGLLFLAYYSLSGHRRLQCPQNLPFKVPKYQPLQDSDAVFLPLSSSQTSPGYFGPRVSCHGSLSLVPIPKVKRERERESETLVQPGFITSGLVCHWGSSHPPDTRCPFWCSKDGHRGPNLSWHS